MKKNRFFKEKALRPDQLNPEGQVTDKKLLNPDRFKFGVASMMYQSEEIGLAPVHTKLVQMLGGSNLHIGMVSGASSLSSMVQWIGAVLLKKFGSNKIAMNFALSGGIFFGLMLALAMTCYYINPQWGAICLVVYIIGAFGLAGASGVQVNVESSWIGDLVPPTLRGYFTSVKWIISSLGVVLFLNLFGQLGTWFPSPLTFALIFLLVALSHLVAILLMSTVTDREPQSVKLAAVAADSDEEQLNYASLPLWCYIIFYVCWSGGRTALIAFTTAYMISYFGFSLGIIALLITLQSVVSLIMLLVMGKVSDKFGTRLPLMIVSGTVGLSMMLWVGSAWFGVGAIIAYLFINGAAGNTHSMLAINYSLEIFPARGRAAYIGFSRIFIGACALLFSVVSGRLLDIFGDTEMTLWGARIVNYHWFFFCCSLLTACCVIPLLIAGRRQVKNR